MMLNNLLHQIKKILITRVALKTSNYILLVACYIGIFYNLFTVQLNLQAKGFQLRHGLAYVVADLLSIYVVVALFLSCCAFSKILLKFWVVFFIVLSTMVTYFIINFKLMLTNFLVGKIFVNNFNVLSMVLSWQLLVFFIIFALIPIYIFIYKIKIPYITMATFKNQFNVLAFAKVGLVLCIVWIMVYVLQPQLISNRYILKNALSVYTPVNYMAATYLYFYKIPNIKNNLVQSKKIRKTSLNIMENSLSTFSAINSLTIKEKIKEKKNFATDILHAIPNNQVFWQGSSNKSIKDSDILFNAVKTIVVEGKSKNTPNDITFLDFSLPILNKKRQADTKSKYQSIENNIFDEIFP